MQLNITFRQFGASEALKEYARQKVDRVHKILEGSGEAHVVLSLERHLHFADITIHSGRWVLRGRESSSDMYASIDLAMDKIERQLRRHKERIKHHHGRDRVHHRQDLMNGLRVRHTLFDLDHPEADAEPQAPAAPPPPAAAARPPATNGHAHGNGVKPPAAEPRVVRSNEFLAQAMNVHDAVVQMDLLNNDFLVFRNADSQQMSVVYRRKDGQYGLLELPPNGAEGARATS